MVKRDYSDTGQRSQSDELFEDIFHLALTKEQRKKKGAKGASQSAEKSGAATETSPRQKKKVSPAPPLTRREAKPPEQKAAKNEMTGKGPRSGGRTRLLILLLLLAAAGAAAAYLYLHLKQPDFFQSTPEQTAIKRGMPPKPPAKRAVVEPQKSSSQVPGHVSPAAQPPQDRAAETEPQPGFTPPRRVPQSAAEGIRSEVKVEAPSQPPAPAGKDALPAGQGEAPAPTATRTAPQNKTPAALAPPPSPAAPRSFPYSVYLGSFKKEEALQTALAVYREKGLSPYVVRMDLGPKGVWRRVFSGHFETREEADAFIKKNRLSEAETKQTRYAVLIGEFSSKEQVETRLGTLKDAGCHPYVIAGNQSSLRIYSGAYYRMEDAEKELAWLASRGVKGKIVER